MHDAAAAVAGGSIRAMEAILRGDEEHAFHPGGGLHHAMPDRASGFCIYDDPALAIARARRDGLRVMYIDLDVHHGDGVQAMFWEDPGVLTVSFHETGCLPVPGEWLRRRGRGGDRGRDGGQRAARADDRRGRLARRGAVAAPRAGRRVRAGCHRQPARCRLARVGPARAPAHDDDRDGRGGPAGRCHRASSRRRSLAGDRGRRLRRVPGRATLVEPGLARRCPPRGPDRDAGRVARPLGDRGRPLRPGAAAGDVRRCPERGDPDRCDPGGRPRRSRGRRRRSFAG